MDGDDGILKKGVVPLWNAVAECRRVALKTLDLEDGREEEKEKKRWNGGQECH